MNQIIDRCEESNGQYNWQQYLEFIERVAPVKTGLKIPESKRPLDYAVPMPQPSTNWPNLGPDPVAKEVSTQQTPYYVDFYSYSGPVPIV